MDQEHLECLSTCLKL